MGSLLCSNLEEELVRLSLLDHTSAREAPGKEKNKPGGVFCQGVSPWDEPRMSPPSIANGVIAGSARHTSAIRTGIPAQRKSNDACEAKAAEDALARLSVVFPRESNQPTRHPSPLRALVSSGFGKSASRA